MVCTKCGGNSFFRDKYDITCLNCGYSIDVKKEIRIPEYMKKKTKS